MNNWDDLRYFLAVARAESVSAAAEQLKVNQSTVSRRINSFEGSLKVTLFERFTTGYALTSEGEELRHYAELMEEHSFAIERHIMGKNIALSGPIRVTTPLLFVKPLLMPLLKQFSQLHPDIELQLEVSNKISNLTKQEADVAIRGLTYMPPENLIGREIGKFELAVYGSKKYLKQYQKANGSKPLHWIGEYNNKPRPDWLHATQQNLQLTLRTNDPLVTVDAIKAGMGVGRLPTLIAEQNPDMQRYTNTPKPLIMSMWILRHPGIRDVSRISTFVAFMTEALQKKLNSINSN